MLTECIVLRNQDDEYLFGVILYKVKLEEIELDLYCLTSKKKLHNIIINTINLNAACMVIYNSVLL